MQMSWYSVILNRLNKTIALVLLMVLGTACISSNHIWEGKKQALVLAKQDASCKVEYEKRIWYALFGALPINSFEEGQFFKKPGAAYRLTDGMNTMDLLITVFGGWLVSITTRTYTVEVCQSEYVLQSPQDREAAINRELQNYSGSKDEPLVVIVEDGNKYAGRLVEIDRDYWHLESTGPLAEADKETESNSEPEKEKPDVLELKNGQTLTGKVLAQSRHSIRFRTKAGTRRYLKSAILRLRYRVDMDEDIKKVIKIRRSKITRVLFRGR